MRLIIHLHLVTIQVMNVAITLLSPHMPCVGTFLLLPDQHISRLYILYEIASVLK